MTIDIPDADDHHAQIVNTALESLSEAEKEHLVETVEARTPVTVRSRITVNGVKWGVSASFRRDDEGEIEAISSIEPLEWGGSSLGFDG